MELHQIQIAGIQLWVKSAGWIHKIDSKQRCCSFELMNKWYSYLLYAKADKC